RPLGVKAVSNPVAAAGGDDPETIDDLRANLPLSVRTLGRVVSLRDYEDFARAFAGVAKAQATWTWDGNRRGILITVAGPDRAGPRAADRAGARLPPAGRGRRRGRRAGGGAADPRPGPAVRPARGPGQARDAGLSPDALSSSGSVRPP